ncbi:MAG: hypothetical protein F7C07_08455 [Desulfurococcales archaeon]|nr:hypothetical protein [Desulfurococcales archaeon]
MDAYLGDPSGCGNPMDIKKELLRLLKEDEEFRWAVAGFLGYSEVLKRLEGHDRKFNEIVERLEEHDRKFVQIMERLEEHDKRFVEITERLSEHDRKFNEIMQRLEEHDKKFVEIMERLEAHDRKFDEIVERLEEHDRKFAEITERLVEHDRKFAEIMQRLEEHDKKFVEIMKRLEEHDKKFGELIREISDIKRELLEIRAYMERFSLTLEEEAREVLERRLREKGVNVKLEPLIMPEVEIDIYGATEEVCVIGEASTRAGARIIEAIDRRIEDLKRKHPELLRPKLIKVVYTMWATEDTIEEASGRDVWLVKTMQELTPLKMVEI